MAPHGVKLDTLKQCLEFLQWLHKDSGKQGEVASELFKRINPYYTTNYLNVRDVKEGLSKFLSAVSEFYTRLSKDPAPGNYNNRSADQICNDLLDCVPKFLAAIYFLEYCINNTFKSLGGGGWEKDRPGYEKHWRSYASSGGHLQEYLRATVDEEKYSQIPGLLPGGFGKDEVGYKWYVWDSGYSQGTEMYVDLAKIVDKTNYNYFRSVFVTSAVADTGTQIPNTANALSLVRTLCDIVLGEPTEGGGSLKVALEHGLQRLVPPKSICWKDLREHCVQLRGKLHKLFNTPKRFDFTGQSTGTDNLNKDELAKHTADWLRGKLIWVRGNLVNIKTDASATSDLGAYFTHNFFPYGFTFESKTRFGMSDKDVRALLGDLSSVIDELRNSGVGDLDRLKEILNGQNKIQCQDPPPPPTKPEAPPAKVPANPKAEGTPNQGKKAEGAQNQGKKSEGTSTSPVLTSTASTPSSGDQGASGPRGPTMFHQVPGSPSVKSASAPPSVGTGVQVPPEATPPPAASSPAGDPGSDGPPGVQHKGSPGTGTSGPQPTPPQVPAITQRPSVSGPGPGSTVDQGIGQDAGKVVTQLISQPSDHTSSSGATAPADTAPGGGGSG
ncbi:ribosome binding protein, putative [Babesia ovata]|uniref:Ribosome binding protein, putative n=1 Tax=Babesia ovata TaxID=189622 RepID=A0A2H6KGA8_9APIC|nr:ribosome binding protein, putative [Babesia ovata]GBE62032.1 ribosome binding protein, putative [Babesia ovata]